MEPRDSLNVEEIERYSRQLILRGWSEAAQLRLRHVRVGVSSDFPSAALYLLGAGVRNLHITPGQRTQPSAPALQHFAALDPFSRVSAGMLDHSEVDALITAEAIEAASSDLLLCRINIREISIYRGSQLQQRTQIPASADSLSGHLLAGTTAALMILHAFVMNSTSALSVQAT